MRINMPSNLDAEHSLISTCLIIPGAAAKAVDILKPSDFHHPQLGKLFEVICKLTKDSMPVDLAAVYQATKDKTYTSILMKCVDNYPASQVDHLVNIISGCSMLRNMITKAELVIQRCCKGEAPTAEIIDACHKEILSVTPGGTLDDCHLFDDLIHDRLEHYERVSKGEAFSGIQTGYRAIDRLTGGLGNGDLIILAARPSMGKTAFAQSITRNVNRLHDSSSLIFSLEMSKEQLVDRDISGEAGLNLMRLRTPGIPTQDWREIIGASSRLSNGKLYICDRSSIHISELARIARQMKAKHNIGLIVVDYIQLVTGEAREGRTQEVSGISRGLKGIARELKIPVIALSQLNRKLEDRADKRPQMSDLRESGAIEQDADMIIFIYRDEVYNKDENNPNRGVAEINIAKQRNGPVATVNLAFQHKSARFMDLYEGDYAGF